MAPAAIFRSNCAHPGAKWSQGAINFAIHGSRLAAAATACAEPKCPDWLHGPEKLPHCAGTGFQDESGLKRVSVPAIAAESGPAGSAVRLTPSPSTARRAAPEC